jgi:hypothetical protein
MVVGKKLTLNLEPRVTGRIQIVPALEVFSLVAEYLEGHRLVTQGVPLQNINGSH